MFGIRYLNFHVFNANKSGPVKTKLMSEHCIKHLEIEHESPFNFKYFPCTLVEILLNLKIRMCLYTHIR